MNAHADAYSQFYKRDAQGNLIFCGMNVPEVMQAMTETGKGEPVYLVGTDIIEFQANAAKKSIERFQYAPHLCHQGQLKPRRIADYP